MRIAKRGRGRMSASHHVSADSHLCFPFGRDCGGGAERGCGSVDGWRRLGVEIEALMLSRDRGGVAFKYEGTAGGEGLRAEGSKRGRVSLDMRLRCGGGGWDVEPEGLDTCGGGATAVEEGIERKGYAYGCRRGAGLGSGSIWGCG